MGRESTCAIEIGRERDETKVLLEPPEIIVRGALRRKFAIASVTGLAVEGDALVFTAGGDRVRLELGAKEAAKWVEAIRNPKSVVDKLGVKPGQKVAVVGALEPGLLADLEGRVGALAGSRDGALDALFLVLASARDLSKIPAAMKRLAPAGALWTVRPKGHAEITEAGVREAGLAAGLVDVKVVALGPAHTAEKFVVPLAKR